MNRHRHSRALYCDVTVEREVASERGSDVKETSVWGEGGGGVGLVTSERGISDKIGDVIVNMWRHSEPTPSQ